MGSLNGDPTPLIYTCEQCGTTYIAESAFEADMPNGFYLELRQVTGGKYSHHSTTRAPVFYCTKRCLLGGVADDLPHILVPTSPPETRQV